MKTIPYLLLSGKEQCLPVLLKNVMLISLTFAGCFCIPEKQAEWSHKV